MYYRVLTLTLAGWLLSVAQVRAVETFTPDFRLKTDDYTVLMAVDARLSEGLHYQPGGHGKFFVKGWQHSEQSAAWTIRSEITDDFSVNVLLYRVAGSALQVEITTGGTTISAVLVSDQQGWQRLTLPGTIPIAKGENKITLRLASKNLAERFEAHVLSVELVRPAIRDGQHKRALADRANTTWLQQAGHGVMVHWTSESKPRQGEPKSYSQAVADFNVVAFADQIQRAGAGFVVFTTAHAYQYFPAPIAALDKILPGRTTQRDLVRDLADELNRRDIKLMLYYHLGSGSDPEWLKASGFWQTDTTRFFGNWQKIIVEVGERYRDDLAGWWFDDGAVTYYYRSAPWEQLHRASRAGNQRRLVGFNPWELPSPTDFQDYYCGEFRDDPSAAIFPPAGGTGHMPAGPYAELQACATIVAERDWVHIHKNQPIGPLRWSSPQLATLLRDYRNRKIVPIFNLEIYQDGTLSTGTLDIFHEATSMLKRP